MNKLGFYIENSTVPFMREALASVKPPVILFHAGDRGLLREIRSGLSPNSFIIGRLFVPLDEQVGWLDAADPDGAGVAYANRILEYDFGYATERVNGRLLIDAWMGPNETLPGPASFKNYQLGTPLDRYPEFAEFFQRRSQALDRFQAAFRLRLQTAGVEAVAFNFGAGNYIHASHYLDWFPRTLETYRYLGFHEYGWPTLLPRAGSSSAALLYREAMRGICQRYNNRHTAIVTEAGLARMYKILDGGDVGWLYPPDAVTEDAYWESLDWYNDQLCRDAYALGACLFQVGHAGRWETFRHLGVDNRQRPITLSNRIATLKDRPAPPLNPDCTTPVEYPADEWRANPGPVARPAWTDVHTLLLRSPTVRYAVRPWNTIKRLIIHHTVTAGDVTPDLIARAQVQQGKPGITYHFVIQANGAIYQTNTLPTTAMHTGVDAVNADSIGVALAGDFSAAAPPASQMTSAARLCAFLMQEFGLAPTAISGRSEVEPGVASPGAQWLQGAAWKNSLLTEIHSQFPEPPLSCEEQLAQARADLTQARSDLAAALERAQRAEAQAAQTPTLLADVARLQTDNQSLRAQLGDGELILTQVQVQVADLQDLNTHLQRQVAEQQASMTALQAQVADLQQRLADCQAGNPPDDGNPPGGGNPPDDGNPPGDGQPPRFTRPDLQDVSAQLPHHATARYDTRAVDAIHRIVVHHTVTRDNVTPERIAQVQVSQGRAGITYHFLITGDGVIYQTNALETVCEQTVTPAINQEGVAVAYAGNFTDVPPTNAQIRSGARLTAWLLQELHLTADAIVGRSELESVGSPGKQWLLGARWKEILLQTIQQL